MKIPYGKQKISQEDIEAVVEVLKSDYLTQGPTVPEFEDAICDYTSSKFAVAVNSGTSALHLSCIALGLKKDDWLWTSPISFVASANCGLYCGAKVDFVDIDPNTWNISVDKLGDKLEKAKINNKLPKVLVAVHLCGLPCDMEPIYELSKKYSFRIIEDACHAIGAKYKGEPVGNCKFSDISVFSFHPVKTVTTGEGGMAVTNNSDLADKMMLFRSHGITRNEQLMKNSPAGPWYYEQIALGFNYRMSDIHAALGRSQIKKIDKFVNKRNKIAQRYKELLSGLPVKLPYESAELYSGYHLYVVRLNNDHTEVNQKDLFKHLRKNGIGVNLHYIPIHTQPYFKKLGFRKDDYKEALLYYKEAISLPIFPDLTEEMQVEVVETLKESL